jgi:hypothetical protein
VAQLLMVTVPWWELISVMPYLSSKKQVITIFFVSLAGD